MVLDDQARDHFASHSWEKVGLATIRAYQNIKRFDAADLFSNVGIVAGSTRIVDPTSGDGQGFVTYGPYAVFSPGSYTITVHYQSSDSIHEVVSQFEVFDANSDSMIFTTAMSGTGGDMATPTYHVNFDFTTMGKIEFRIFWFGRFRLVVERIEIAPLG